MNVKDPGDVEGQKECEEDGIPLGQGFDPEMDMEAIEQKGEEGGVGPFETSAEEGGDEQAVGDPEERLSGVGGGRSGRVEKGEPNREKERVERWAICGRGGAVLAVEAVIEEVLGDFPIALASLPAGSGELVSGGMEKGISSEATEEEGGAEEEETRLRNHEFWR